MLNKGPGATDEPFKLPKSSTQQIDVLAHRANVDFGSTLVVRLFSAPVRPVSFQIVDQTLVSFVCDVSCRVTTCDTFCVIESHEQARTKVLSIRQRASSDLPSLP